MLMRLLSPIIALLAALSSLAPCSNVAALVNSKLPTISVTMPADQPSADIVQLAAAATMTDKAKAIFYAAQPAIDDDRALFEQHCHAPVSSNTIELGCYTPDNRIYLLRISDPQLKNEMAVTAAHEMLHVVYAQLSSADRASINTQLEAAATRLRSADLTSALRTYRTMEPGQRDNELHSILGTEYSPLGAALEQYYGQYLSNRVAVVAYARQFDQVFSQFDTTLASLQAQIKSLRAQMQIESRHHDAAAFNAHVPELNALVQQYNQTLARSNQLSRELRAEESPVSNP